MFWKTQRTLIPAPAPAPAPAPNYFAKFGPAPPEQGTQFFQSTTKDKELTLTAELPGVRPELLTMSVEDNRLKVKVPLRNMPQTFKEYVVSLNIEWDAHTAAATLELGVLTVVVQRKPINRAHNIPITVK